MPTAFYRRNLPHLQNDAKRHFLTFCTLNRWILPDEAKTFVLQSMLHDHEKILFVDCAVVMPDHAHMIFVPIVDEGRNEMVSLARITQAIKSSSAHIINHRLGRKGRIWQEESFDHVLRCSETLDQKIDYVVNNPVRAGLVTTPTDYPWFWRAPERSQLQPPSKS